MSLTLGEKRKLFMKMLPRLLDKALDLGYEVEGGELLRPQATADYYASIGKGISRSLHRLGLAIDLLLFRDGVYLQLTEDYRDLGEWWESQSTDTARCCWGGHFNDGDHFSIEHEGVR